MLKTVSIRKSVLACCAWLSCGQSSSPAHTVFIRDVVNKANKGIFGWWVFEILWSIFCNGHFRTDNRNGFKRDGLKLEWRKLRLNKNLIYHSKRGFSKQIFGTLRRKTDLQSQRIKNQTEKSSVDRFMFSQSKMSFLKEIIGSRENLENWYLLRIKTRLGKKKPSSQHCIKTMLKPVSARKSVLACNAWLSCGQSSSPARTVFIRDVAHNASRL